MSNFDSTHRLDPIRCCHFGPEGTWEQWQGRGNPYSPKLKHFWSLAIRLFSVITRKLIEGLICRDAVEVFCSPSRLGIFSREYCSGLHLFQLISNPLSLQGKEAHKRNLRPSRPKKLVPVASKIILFAPRHFAILQVLFSKHYTLCETLVFCLKINTHAYRHARTHTHTHTHTHTQTHPVSFRNI